MVSALPLLRVTIRHYYDFGMDRAIVGDDLVRPDAWDRLRTQTSGVFAIPPTRARSLSERPRGELISPVERGQSTRGLSDKARESSPPTVWAEPPSSGGYTSFVHAASSS